MNYFSRSSKNKLMSCHDDLQKVAMLAIMISEVDFGISCGYRSPERQSELYAQGRTEPGKIVTYRDGYNKKSKHNHILALAFDVYAWIDGRANWNPEYYLKIAEAIKLSADTFDIKIKWGGDWQSFKDYPHFEI